MMREITIKCLIDEKEIKTKDEIIRLGEKLRDFCGLKSVKIKKEPIKRTLTENSALHLWENWIVEHCKNMGFGMTIFYDEPSEIPVTKENLHLLVKKINKQVNDIEETRKLNTIQFHNLVEALKNEMSVKIDFHENFPNKDYYYYKNL